MSDEPISKDKIDQLKRINKKLQEEVEKGGTKVVPGFTDSYIRLKEIKRESLKHPENLELRDLVEALEKEGVKDCISKNTNSNFAHEVGHSRHTFGREGASKIGKAAHSIYLNPTYQKIALPGKNAPSLASLSAGFASGYNSVKKERKGEKESKLSKYGPTVAAAAISAPMILSEAAASKKGLQLLKEAGADKKLLSQMRNQYLKTGGTYVTGSLINPSLTLVGRGLGKAAANKIEKSKDKEN